MASNGCSNIQRIWPHCPRHKPSAWTFLQPCLPAVLSAKVAQTVSSNQVLPAISSDMVAQTVSSDTIFPTASSDQVLPTVSATQIILTILSDKSVTKFVALTVPGAHSLSSPAVLALSAPGNSTEMDVNPYIGWSSSSHIHSTPAYLQKMWNDAAIYLYDTAGCQNDTAKPRFEGSQETWMHGFLHVWAPGPLALGRHHRFQLQLQYCQRRPRTSQRRLHHWQRRPHPLLRWTPGALVKPPLQVPHEKKGDIRPHNAMWSESLYTVCFC